MSKRRKITIAVILAIIILLGGVLGIFVVRKFLAHERTQQTEIQNLKGEVELLSERFRRSQDYYLFETSWGEGFNWLALGNSLTLIESWGRGICATKPDNDYFGIVKKHLEEKYSDVATFRYNYYVWERASNRSSVYDLVDSFLDPRLDLVTIQLGENAFDLSTYEADIEDLVNHIHSKAADAKIIIIDDFWDNEKSTMRKKAAEKTGVAFADLSSIRGKKEYQSAEGTVCYLADGSTILVNIPASETHPSAVQTHLSAQ